MQAAVLESPGNMLLVDHADPADPGPDEVLVAVRRVGICGTDHHAYRGMQNFFLYPRVLGHEVAVEVLEVGHGVTGCEGAISAPCCPTSPAGPATAASAEEPTAATASR